MRHELTTTPLDRLRPVFLNVGENIKRYEQIRILFGTDNAYFLFAEPVITGVRNEQITWFGHHDGTYRRFTDLSIDEQTQATEGLKADVNNLYRLALRYSRSAGGVDIIKYRQVADSLTSFVEIPDYNNIWQVATSQGARYVLINWGFWGDDNRAERHLLSKVVPLGTVPVRLAAIFSDTNEPAPNEPIQIAGLASPLVLTSDASGHIDLDDVPLLTELIIGQPGLSGSQFNAQKLVVDERFDAYKISLKRPRLPMRFRVLNQHGRPAANRPIRLGWGSQTADLTTPADGVLLLPDVPLSQTVLSTDLGSTEPVALQNHTFSRTEPEYILTVHEEPVKKPLVTWGRALGCLGLLVLLVVLLIGGLLAYVYFKHGENPFVSEKELVESKPQKFVVAPATCNGGQDGQDYVQAETQEVLAQYDLGKPNGRFVFSYFTMFAPDLIEVYTGKQADLTTDSKPIFHYFGSTASDQGINTDGNGGGPLEKTLTTPDRYVTVRVVGRTVWNYKVGCPTN